MEFRAFWEFGAIVPFWPLLQRAPLGDGHPVIVFPGLSASDGSTVPLRSYLTNRNYDVSGWNQGHNFGPRAGVLEAGSHQIRETFLAAGKRKVSLIGWSLGGIYARELAKLHPPLRVRRNKRIFVGGFAWPLDGADAVERHSHFISRTNVSLLAGPCSSTPGCCA